MAQPIISEIDMGAIWIFLKNSALPTVEAWNAAIKAQGFDLALDPFNLRTENCYRPAILNGQETGFMWFLSKTSSLKEDADFRFKAHIGDCDLWAQLDCTAPEIEDVASKIAGAALAKLTAGFYFDAESPDHLFYSGDAAISIAWKAFHDWEAGLL